jgi:hypothetical protein
MTIGPRFGLRVASAALLVVVSQSSRAVASTCTGDCNSDGSVSVDELVMGVGIAMGDVDISQCPAMDAQRDSTVGVNDLVRAINVALKGCAPTLPFASIQQVFTQSCAFAACHSAQARRGNLVLSDEELSYANLVLVQPDNQEAADMALWRVLPGNPDRSFLLRKLHGLGPGDRMPQGYPPLSDDVIHMIEDWIRRGAPTTADECRPVATSGTGSHRTGYDATNCNGQTPPPTGDYVWQPLPPLDPPPAGEGIQLHTPPRNVEPGKEWETCYAFPVDPSVLQSTAIQRQLYRMQPGSHHLLLYMYFGAHPEQFTYGDYWPCFAGQCTNSKDCPSDNGAFQIPIGGTQVAGTAYDVSYPPGVGIPLLGSHPVLIVNLHDQNPFLPAQEIYGEAWVNLYFYKPSEFKVLLDGIFAINAKDLLVEPYETRTITSIWRPHGLLTPSGVDAAIFQLFGHMHKRGTEFTIHFVDDNCPFSDFAKDPDITKYPDCTGVQIYRTTEWDNAPVTNYDPPYLLVNKDQGLRWTCTHQNGRRIAVTHDDGSVTLEDDPTFPPKKCEPGCVACGWDEASQTCIFNRDHSGRVFQIGEPMPLVFGALADDDMCNMFGYFVDENDVGKIGQ